MLEIVPSNQFKKDFCFVPVHIPICFKVFFA